MKKITDEFRKIFPRTTEGYSKTLDGYYYVRNSKLYVYYLKESLNGFKPVPDKLIFPKDKSNYDAEEVVKITVDYTIPKLLNIRTSTYHGKVVRLEDAKKLVSLDVDVTLSPLPESIIPFEKARDVILQNPDHICVVECPCRGTKENPCYPLDVCMIIGEPFVSFVMEHNQDNPRRITKEEAIEILKAEDERGHVHNAYFKDAMGDRFYCICNCCKCCCTAMSAHHYLKAPMMAPSGYVRVENLNCRGCGTCVRFCQFNALSLIEGKSVVNQDKCMGCGICESKCGHGAISLSLNESKGLPFDIDRLIDQYAVNNEK